MSNGGVEALYDDRGRGPRIPDQLQLLPACGARDEARIISLDLLAAQRRQRALGGGDVQRVAGRITQQRQQGAPRVEKANGIAHHLLDDAVQLERVRQDVRQLLQRKELGQATIELLSGAAALLLGAHQPLP